LYVSLELGGTTWLVLSTIGLGQRARRMKLRAGDTAGLAAEIVRARQRYQLDSTAQVYSCYEAGRDGFWLHRWLAAHGVRNLVVDSASIRVSRRRREAKTDRLDAEALLQMLLRAVAGERKVWSVVHVPTPDAEDRRQLNREWEAAKTERRRTENRIRSLLATQGIRARVTSDLSARLPTLETGDGGQLGPLLHARLQRECAHLAAVETRCATLVAVRQQQLRAPSDAVSQCARQLQEIKGIGAIGAEMLSAELFGTRTFHNGREVGALVGLTPTPYRSDQSGQEQGHSRTGRGALRGLMTQLAWGWLRFQPRSVLTRWYHTRFAAGPRLRRIGIVAVARKLVVALWHYVAHGIVPEGAMLRA
jgi:transposase